MKKRIIGIVLLLFVVQLGGCQNNGTRMKEKFEWSETLSCPTGYPVEIYRGGLISKDGKYTSLFLGIHDGPWGSTGRSMRDGVKQVPNRLEAIWVSYAEDCTYEINTEIDYDKMLQLFNEGYYTPAFNESVLPRKENYDQIVVGLAPGGMVVIWLNGGGRQVEIGRYQANKVEIPAKEIAQLEVSDALLFSKTWREEIMKNPRIVPLEIQKENENKPIPLGLWDSYRKRYKWKLELDLPDNAKAKKFTCFFYNGEISVLFGADLMEKNPTIVFPENLKWDTTELKAIPSNVNFSWLLDIRYVGEIKFNEQEIVTAFEELTKANPDGEITMSIYVNQSKSYARVGLVSGDMVKWLINNEITFTDVNLKY